MNLDSFKPTSKLKTLTLPTSLFKSESKSKSKTNSQAQAQAHEDYCTDGYNNIYENINYAPTHFKYPLPPTPNTTPNQSPPKLLSVAKIVKSNQLKKPSSNSMYSNTNNSNSKHSKSYAEIPRNSRTFLDESGFGAGAGVSPHAEPIPVEVNVLHAVEELKSNILERGTRTRRRLITEQVQTKAEHTKGKSNIKLSSQQQQIQSQLQHQLQQRERHIAQRQRQSHPQFESMPIETIDSVGIDTGEEAEVKTDEIETEPSSTQSANTNITQILSADPHSQLETNAQLTWQMEDCQEVKIPSDQLEQEHEDGNGRGKSKSNRNSLSSNNNLLSVFLSFDSETEPETQGESLTSASSVHHQEDFEFEAKEKGAPDLNSKSNNNYSVNFEPGDSASISTSVPSSPIISSHGHEDKEEHGDNNTATRFDSDSIDDSSCVEFEIQIEEEKPLVPRTEPPGPSAPVTTVSGFGAAAMFRLNSVKTAETDQDQGQDQVRDVEVEVVMAEREDEEKLFQNHVLSPKLVISPTFPQNSKVPTTPINTNTNNLISLSTAASASGSVSSSSYTSANTSIYSNFTHNHNLLPQEISSSSSSTSQHRYNNIEDYESEVPLQVPLRRNKIEQQRMFQKQQTESLVSSSELSDQSHSQLQGQGQDHVLLEDVIRSVNGVTTIEIKPIHHVIDLSPQKAEEIKRNRLQYKKASRLSQFMSSEFKLDSPIGNALNVNRARSVGFAVKRKFGDWVRRIHDEDEKFKSQGNLNEFQDEDAQGQNEFEELRRLVKQGGDFCKDLSAVLQERSELEATYSKGLAKLSSKLLKASKEATGSVAHAWQAVAVHIDTQAELHRLWSVSLQEEVARPLKTSTETQSKIRKSVEVLVDKTTRNLAEWRMAEAKAKRQCFSCSKEFEKLQESNPNTEVRSRLLSVPPSDPIKLESKKRKAEETVRRADIEYYTFCVRSERARLEWESSIRNGSTCLRTLEEEKLTLLKDLAYKYFHAMSDLMPKLMRSTEVLEEPIKTCNVEQDMQTMVVRRHAGSEQLLPDFYAEDTSNLMKKDRRSEALQKCLFLIKQDLDRERKGTVGVENLAKAIAEAPKIDNSHHDISDKLYYMKSMLLYLEAARIKLDITLADVEGRQKPTSAIIQYMRHQRDKQGLPQTILKVPSWARDDCLTPNNESPDWSNEDRNIQLNHVNQLNHVDHDTDFDEFSSEAGSSDNVYEEDKDSVPSIGKCRVLYDYDKNLFDELTIRAGDQINIHDKQEDGWWLGELKGIVGIFPATYVEEIESSE